MLSELDIYSAIPLEYSQDPLGAAFYGKPLCRVSLVSTSIEDSQQTRRTVTSLVVAMTDSRIIPFCAKEDLVVVYASSNSDGDGARSFDRNDKLTEGRHEVIRDNRSDT